MVIISKEPLIALYKKVNLNRLPDPGSTDPSHQNRSTLVPQLSSLLPFYTADQTAVT